VGDSRWCCRGLTSSPYLADGRLGFDPPIGPDRVAQVSIDLRLDRKFVWPRREPPKYLPAVFVDPELWGSDDLWERAERDVYRLHRGQFVLAQTLERIRIPADLVGLVEGRSSFARVGVTVHVRPRRSIPDSTRTSRSRWRTSEDCRSICGPASMRPPSSCSCG
jgi:deoxycytidine triphosphate deaminase